MIRAYTVVKECGFIIVVRAFPAECLQQRLAEEAQQRLELERRVSSQQQELDAYQR
jgi:hypothetical protein